MKLIDAFADWLESWARDLAAKMERKELDAYHRGLEEGREIERLYLEAKHDSMKEE
jgi:hypothetical protein